MSLEILDQLEEKIRQAVETIQLLQLEVEELKELRQPVVDWLKKNHDPHTEVHITAEHIDLMESAIGIPVK